MAEEYVDFVVAEAPPNVASVLDTSMVLENSAFPVSLESDDTLFIVFVTKVFKADAVLLED